MGFSRRKPGRRGCAVEACRAGMVYGGFLKESEGNQMKEYKVPVQSLIDHIKTAIDVDDWAKEMAEDLLKEQEAVAPKRIDGKRNHFTKCGNCNHDLMSGYHYCPHCGKAVKWND